MGYPFTNVPPYMMPQLMPAPQQVNYQNAQRIYVQGEAGAKSYLVAPNNGVTLWDSEAPVIYLKSADANGMPAMTILDYKIRGAETPNKDVENATPNTSIEYVLKSDFDALKGELEAFKEEMKHVPRQNIKGRNNKGGNL